MKYLLIFSLVAAMGCSEARSNYKPMIYTIEYQGCEYVIREGAYEYGICHKGNCKYCAERLKQKP